MNKLIVLIWLNGTEISNFEASYADPVQCVSHSLQIQQVAISHGYDFMVNCLEVK